MLNCLRGSEREERRGTAFESQLRSGVLELKRSFRMSRMSHGDGAIFALALDKSALI